MIASEKQVLFIKNISEINKTIKKQTNKDVNIIKKINSGYCINIDPAKPYSLFIHDDILKQK